MKGNNKNRDRSVDAFRGLAILLVVLFHTIATSSKCYEESVVFNFCALLQMPIFFLISGYVCKYSRGIQGLSGLKQYVLRRTRAYLLPWAVFTLFGKAILMGDAGGDLGGYFLNLLWHMDTGYWFLFALWVICMMFGLASVASEKLSGVKGEVVFLLVFSAFLGLAGVVGLRFGGDFLCVKLVAYYAIFYLGGYYYGKFQDLLQSKSIAVTVRKIIVAISACVFAGTVALANGHGLVVNDLPIIQRFVLSGCSCIAFMAAMTPLLKRGVAAELLSLVGNYSLELYLLHGFFLRVVQFSAVPFMCSVEGVVIVSVNYLMALLLSALVIVVLSSNEYLRLVLFGRK